MVCATEAVSFGYFVRDAARCAGFSRAGSSVFPAASLFFCARMARVRSFSSRLNRSAAFFAAACTAPVPAEEKAASSAAAKKVPVSEPPCVTAIREDSLLPALSMNAVLSDIPSSIRGLRHRAVELMPAGARRCAGMETQENMEERHGLYQASPQHQM